MEEDRPKGRVATEVAVDEGEQHIEMHTLEVEHPQVEAMEVKEHEKERQEEHVKEVEMDEAERVL